jgi:23S rRNA (cytidine1920-2'-O)/16S rRNA (cytidine1409-2'-O)-methyltransferase
MKKERIDILLVERGLIESREKAKRSIMAGIVYANNERIDKPGTKIPTDQVLEIRGQTHPYVGRGGLKMEKAISEFDLNVENQIVLDIGSSTGGFTDCCLQHGAKHVYALDVGYNQLAWKLRQDKRVTVMEKTNFRYVTTERFQQDLPTLATIDVSFISLRLILPVLKTILQPNGMVVALIKPQFEAGRNEVGKRGIVRSPEIHERVIREIINFSTQHRFQVIDLSYSPITGGNGNIEYLLYLSLPEDLTAESLITDSEVSETVFRAHQQLNE